MEQRCLYSKQENFEKMELTVENPRRRQAFGCQGKAIAVLCVLLVICFVVFTAVLIVNHGKTSMELSNMKMRLEKIPVNSTKELSDLLHSIDSATSKELKTINSRLVKVSEELAETKTRFTKIQTDSRKNLSDLHDSVDSKLSTELQTIDNQLVNVTEELSNTKLRLRKIQEDSKQDLSDLRDVIDSKMAKELKTINNQLFNVSEELSETHPRLMRVEADAKKNLSDLWNSIDSTMSKKFQTIESQIHTISKELADTKQKVMIIQADSWKNLLAHLGKTEIRNLTHFLVEEVGKELAEVKKDYERFQNSLSSAQEELKNLTELFCTRCPKGWVQDQKICYFISTSSKNWRDSKKFCADQGAHLAIINSKRENKFLSNQILDIHAYWLGLSDEDEEGYWHWVDGTSLTLKFWNKGEPNDAGRHGEDCATLLDGGKWNDAPCHGEEYWICEQKCEPDL
ncbi:C-type lectin domain family 4 member M-like [Alligator sinensis]|uniref:C-type lectin domain family 4 member M-like n=1 Tax=Alligator sinensis TaxID=38654 RepID=A0A1U7RHJ3_ALLSI|nr:C-type lectin domain family 4 member M-like [Alligator sinensis]